MKALALAVAASCVALPAFAQESFSGSFTLSGALEESHAVSGSIFGVEPAGTGPGWMAPEAYGERVDAGVQCQSIDEFELDYFYGETGGYVQQVLVTVVRQDRGWAALDPAVFYDVETTDGQRIVATWETYDNAVAQVIAVECVDGQHLRAAIRFAAVMTSLDGAGPLAIEGEVDAVMRLMDMAFY